jgi:hypothetical protein
MFKSKLLAAAGLAFGAALAVAPGAVHAQLPPPFVTPPLPPAGTVSDVLAFSGFATIVPPSSPCGNYVCVMGGSGTFNFSSSACAGVSDGEPVPEALAACSISVTGGTFQNVVCGTGHAGGTATITGEPEGPENASFDIDFAATVGVTFGILTETNPPPTTTEPFYGVVQIGPNPNTPAPDPTVGQCASGFSVTGAIVAIDVVGAP